MEQFTIQKNDFLSHDCIGYFHLYYVGDEWLGNPNCFNSWYLYKNITILLSQTNRHK